MIQPASGDAPPLSMPVAEYSVSPIVDGPGKKIWSSGSLRSAAIEAGSGLLLAATPGWPPPVQELPASAIARTVVRAIDHRQFNRAQLICKLYGRMPQKVVVLGAGAIGSLVGARLHEAGADVRLIGRQDHVDAIRANGLLLKDQGKTRRVRLPATTTLADDADIILLTVKSQDVTRACREIAGVHSNATVLTMQNGVRSDGEAAGILGRDRIVGCVLNLSATYLEPGVVEQNTGALLQVGAPFPESADRVEAVLALLSPIMKTEYVPDIARARWTKLMANLNNAIMAITGLPIGKALGHRGMARMAISTICEGVRTAT